MKHVYNILLVAVCVVLNVAGSDAISAPKMQELDMTCDHGKEPGAHFDAGSPKLPPIAQRTILGVWQYMNPKVTISLERVNGRIFEVFRSRFCQGGDVGQPLRSGRNNTFFIPESTQGDYFRIEQDGSLGVYDRAGFIDRYARRNRLFAD